MKTITAFMVGFILLFGFLPARAAQPFYSGKTLTVIVGYPPGGGYAAYAQVLSKYLGKHVPGNPRSSFNTCQAEGALSPRIIFLTVPSLMGLLSEW
jgi:tripartite-type tricarboxylate transporter receptor subunit TctC